MTSSVAAFSPCIPALGPSVGTRGEDTNAIRSGAYGEKLVAETVVSLSCGWAMVVVVAVPFTWCTFTRLSLAGGARVERGPDNSVECEWLPLLPLVGLCEEEPKSFSFSSSLFGVQGGAGWLSVERSIRGRLRRCAIQVAA